MLKRGLIASSLALATVLATSPAAFAGSWQSFGPIKEVDGGNTVAKVSGNFYSSKIDDTVEFRGTLWASAGNCAYVEFLVQMVDAFPENYFKAAEDRRVCNTSTTNGYRDFDTTRNSFDFDINKVKIRVCQEQWGPDDCESDTNWMVD
jgi:hypothetical protein